MIEIEKEFKLLLNQAQFKQLFDYFACKDQDFIQQENIYYDTNQDQLKHLEAALRLRNLADRSEWTLKQKQDCYQAIEINQANSSPIEAPNCIAQADIQQTALLDFLKKHGICLEDLKLTYRFITKRWQIPTAEGLYVLDQTTYSQGITDYELEFEVQDLDQGQAAFERLLDQFDLKSDQAPTKISRAVKYRQS